MELTRYSTWVTVSFSEVSNYNKEKHLTSLIKQCQLKAKHLEDEIFSTQDIYNKSDLNI
jgi:hypothetical protein